MAVTVHASWYGELNVELHCFDAAEPGGRLHDANVADPDPLADVSPKVTVPVPRSLADHPPAGASTTVAVHVVGTPATTVNGTHATDVDVNRDRIDAEPSGVAPEVRCALLP